MTSSNENNFRVIGPLWNSPFTGEFPAQKPVTRSFDIFFDLRLDQKLSKPWRRRDLTSLCCVAVTIYDNLNKSQTTFSPSLNHDALPLGKSQRRCSNTRPTGVNDIEYPSETHLNSSPLDKMTTNSRTISSDAFSWMKSFVFWLKFHQSLFLSGSNTQWPNIGLDNCLAPNKRQAIVCANVDPIHYGTRGDEWNSNLVKTRTSITNVSVVQSFWNLHRARQWYWPEYIM